MYEHNGKLLVRTDRGYEIVTLEIHEDGGYTITPTGKKYTSRPKGATHTTVNNVIIQYGLVAGDTYPPETATPSGSQGQPDATDGVDK